MRQAQRQSWRSGMDDSYNLQRFVDAQQSVFEDVLEELRRGQKSSHWMWFIFPQIKGLGYSSMAQRYAIQSLAEAQAYLAHPVLGPRLRECTARVNAVEGRSIQQILGYPDDLKFKSSMTLFMQAAEDNAIFLAALTKYFDGELDPLTLDRL